VFAGYGIVAPEHGWDDYKDADVRGKVVVLLNFNPPFAGEGVRLWYGRWDYKFLTAAAHGAAGALIVHTTASAGYPWQVLSSSADGVRIDLPAGDEPRMQFQGGGTGNGALDNASGCAAILSIARAAQEAPPKRSLLFVFVTAEEQGLLGSRWFARHPVLAPGRIAADINVDSVNRFGRTTDLGMMGLGK